eukprot:g8852.t1
MLLRILMLCLSVSVGVLCTRTTEAPRSKFNSLHAQLNIGTTIKRSLQTVNIESIEELYQKSENSPSSEQKFLIIDDSLAYEPPSCVSWGNNRVDCVYHGLNSNVYHQPIINGVPQPPKNIGGLVYKNVLCVAMAEDNIRCIILGKDNSILTAALDVDTWSDWESVGRAGSEIGVSSCTTRIKGLFECVLRMQLDRPGYIVAKNGTFADEIDFLRWNYRSSFSCIAPKETSLVCYAGCYSNSLCFNEYEEGGHWSRNNVVRLGPLEMTSAPRAVKVTSKKHHILATEQGYKLFHVIWTHKKGYTKRAQIESLVLSSAPECLAVNEEELYCFALGMDHALYKIHYDGETWNDWQWVGGAFLEKPTCVLSDTKKISCILRSFHSSLIMTVFTLP